MIASAQSGLPRVIFQLLTSFHLSPKQYLRASLGNATLIDGVLENIVSSDHISSLGDFFHLATLNIIASQFNGIFYFFLALTVLSVLQLKPWALLATLSTILVSFAFALGSSASKLIEGMIMIAIRRP